MEMYFPACLFRQKPLRHHGLAVIFYSANLPPPPIAPKRMPVRPSVPPSGCFPVFRLSLPAFVKVVPNAF